jgi:hypothetical protein
MVMKTKIFFAAVLLSLLYCTPAISGTGQEVVGLRQSILMFPGAPNPCDAECLVRVYLPQKDANASIKIFNSDSAMVKQVSLANEKGVGSALLHVSDLQPGNYTYQLYYGNQTQYTRAFTIKRSSATIAR